MDERKPLEFDAGRIGNDQSQYRGVHGGVSANYQPMNDVTITGGADFSAGQGNGYVDATASPYAGVTVGPLNAEISKDYYASRSDGGNLYTGQGPKQVSAGLVGKVGDGNFRARVQRVLSRGGGTSAQINYNVPF